MCRHCKEHHPPFHHGRHNHNEGSFLKGAMFGALLGAVIGVLYAPGVGTETRKKVKKEIDKIKTKVEPVIDEIKEKSGPVLENLQENSGPLIDKAKAKINEVLEDIDDEMKKNKKHKKGFFKL